MVKTIKKVSFDGQDKKILGLFDGSVTVPANSAELDLDDQAIRELNDIAYCYLLYNMGGDICFQLVDTARTYDLADGDASLAWKNLLTRFEPRQFGSVLELIE